MCAPVSTVYVCRSVCCGMGGNVFAHQPYVQCALCCGVVPSILIVHVCTLCVYVHMYPGGDQRPGEHRAECGVLLPYRERGPVLHSPIQRNHGTPEAGTGRRQGRVGPSQLHTHPAG